MTFNDTQIELVQYIETLEERFKDVVSDYRVELNKLV